MWSLIVLVYHVLKGSSIKNYLKSVFKFVMTSAPLWFHQYKTAYTKLAACGSAWVPKGGCYIGWQAEQCWAKLLSDKIVDGLLAMLQISPKRQKKNPAFFLVSFHCWWLSASFNSSLLLFILSQAICSTKTVIGEQVQYLNPWGPVPWEMPFINSHSGMKDAVQVQRCQHHWCRESPKQAGDLLINSTDSSY